MSYEVVQYILDNGEAATVMVMANNYGQTELNTLDNGECIELMEKANLFILMGICTTDNGQMIKPMDMACTSIKTALNTQVTGEMIYNTGWEYKIGPIIHHTKGCISLAKSTGKERTNGVTEVNTQVIGRTIK